jgi:hypothetical protein
MSEELKPKCDHDFIIVAWQYIYRKDKDNQTLSWSDDPEDRRRKMQRSTNKTLTAKQARKVWCRKCDAIEYLNLAQDI